MAKKHLIKILLYPIVVATSVRPSLFFHKNKVCISAFNFSPHTNNVNVTKQWSWKTGYLWLLTRWHLYLMFISVEQIRVYQTMQMLWDVHTQSLIHLYLCCCGFALVPLWSSWRWDYCWHSGHFTIIYSHHTQSRTHTHTQRLRRVQTNTPMHIHSLQQCCSSLRDRDYSIDAWWSAITSPLVTCC